MYADKIRKDSAVVVDLSHDLAFGDTILRLGALQILQKNCKLTVNTNRHELLREAGISSTCSYNTLESAVHDSEFIVLPPSWAESGQDYWSKKSIPRKKKLIEGLLDCDYHHDKRLPLHHRNHPYMNRVLTNFLQQLRYSTRIQFDAGEIIPKSTVLWNNHGQDKCPLLVIGDSASRQDKIWPHYKILVDDLSSKMPGLRFAFIDQKTIFDEQTIQGLKNPQSVVYSAARDGLAGGRAIMREGTAFVGNDSGPAHYFSFQNHASKPTLILFNGKNDPARWMPASRTGDFLYIEDGCVLDKKRYNYYSWQKNFDSSSAGSAADIGSIPKEKVEEKIRRILAGANR